MISAYGAAAARFAARLPTSLEAVIADVASLGNAYREAVDRRGSGQPFYIALLTEDPRVDITRAVARTFVDEPSWDARRQRLDLLDRGTYVVNGKPAAETWVLPEPTRRAALDFITLGDALLVRSAMEYERLSTLTGRRRMNVAVVDNPRSDYGTALEPVERRHIVIWAPHVSADAIAHLVLALEEYRLPVIAVVQSGSLPNVRAHFATYDERVGPAHLAYAACIVDAETAEPGIAQALARACPSIPLVVASTGGAREFLDNVSSYVPWSRASIYAAVCGAFGAGAPYRRPPAAAEEGALQAVLRATEPELATGPLVSIVIPSFNRRSVLPQALRCIEGQTYRDVECVVVNDAGEDIADIVAQFPSARLISLAVNGGVFRALNAGIRAAAGKYVGFLADDDVLYPDHVARNVSALERSGLGASSSNLIVRHMRQGADDTLVLSAFNGETFSYTVDPTDVLFSSPVAGHAMLFRRALFEEIGLLAEDTSIADQEVQMRLMKSTNFAHVDRFTGEWTIRDDPEWNFSRRVTDVPNDLRRIFAKHALVDRPYVEAMRAQVIQNVEARPPNAVFAPTVVFNPA